MSEMLETWCPKCGREERVGGHECVPPKHRFIEVAEQLGATVAEARGQMGRNFIREEHGMFGELLDELDAAYARWLKDEPGGRL